MRLKFKHTSLVAVKSAISDVSFGTSETAKGTTWRCVECRRSGKAPSGCYFTLEFDDASELRAHLGRHMEAGDKVSAEALQALNQRISS